MEKLIGIALLGAGAALVSACAHGMAGSPMRYCTVSEAHEKSTAEYRACMQEQMAILRARGDAQKEQLLRVLAMQAQMAGFPRRMGEADAPAIRGRHTRRLPKLQAPLLDGN